MSEKVLPGTLRQRPLLDEYSVSDAYNAIGGVKATLMSINAENIRLRREVATQTATIKQLEDAILEMQYGEEGSKAAGGE